MRESGMINHCLTMSSIRYQREACWLQDMGFQGFAVACVQVQQPTKKPRGGELCAEQKAENRRIASEKMRIEHTIGSVKRCRIIKDRMRYWQDRIRDMVMVIACGLHNLRLHRRPWNYGTT